MFENLENYQNWTNKNVAKFTFFQRNLPKFTKIFLFFSEMLQNLPFFGQKVGKLGHFGLF